MNEVQKSVETVVRGKIADAAGLAVGDAVEVLLWHSVGRLAMKEATPSDALDFAWRLDNRSFLHIVDWLKSAVKDEDKWLSNTDELARPKKLLKFGSIAAITAEADKAMIRKAKNMRRADLADGAETLFMELDEGYTLVRMHTPEALDRESAEMQHCIGQGGYDDEVADPLRYFLSLRDPYGHPHVTIDIENDEIEQLSGKQNDLPVLKYMNLLKPFFADTRFSAGVYASGDEGVFIDIHGNTYTLDSLPDVLEVRTNVDLIFEADDGEPEVVFPQSIISTSAVEIDVRQIDKAPRSIKGADEVALCGPGFVDLPELVSAAPIKLAMTGTNIAVLPTGMTVAQLVIDSAPLSRLPDDFRCLGDIELRSTEVGALPPSLWKSMDGIATSSGRVAIIKSPVDDLGGLQHVAGDLVLSCAKITALPARLVVDGVLSLINTPVSVVPADTLIGKRIDVIGCDIDLTALRLPPKGNIYISGSQVRLPREIVGISSFTCLESHVHSMSERIICERDIDFKDSVVGSLPTYMRAESLDLRGIDLDILEGDIEVDSITIDDRQFLISDTVKAKEIFIFSDKGRGISHRFSFEEGRRYLRTHSKYLGVRCGKVHDDFKAKVGQRKSMSSDGFGAADFMNMGIMPGVLSHKFDGFILGEDDGPLSGDTSCDDVWDSNDLPRIRQTLDRRTLRLLLEDRL